MRKSVKAILAMVVASGMVFSAFGSTVSAAWVKKGSDYYYENSDGTYRTGWIKTKNGDYYYCLKSGKMAKNCTVTINGVKYTFGEDGKALNKPETETTSSKKSETKKTEKTKSTKSSSSDSKTEGAVKYQNTFPGLVTYGVYVGMSKSDFKALKTFDNFRWDDDLEMYVIAGMYYVSCDNGIVTAIQRMHSDTYGYYTHSGYKDMDSAILSVSNARQKALKPHKKKTVIDDTTTSSIYTDGIAYYETKYKNIQYFMTDVRLDSESDMIYALEGYIYLD